MIVTHKLNWKECLSWKIWPAIEKGWKDEDRNIHFFWGLGGKNKEKILEVKEKGEEWWYVDVGYLTEQITRYPIPKIHNIDKTYFRLCKGSHHTNRGKIGNGQRLNTLKNQGIDVEFKGWYTGETKHILVCPSSETVTYFLHGIDQQTWIDTVVNEIKQNTDREIIIRNKPRPGNEWWETDIRDQLKDAHCLVTDMSLSSIDAIMNRVPVICPAKNIAAPVGSRQINKIEKPLRPGVKTIREWLNYVVEHQFTIPEIEKGIAYETLKVQYEN